jgi:hypothetical protein
LLLGVLERDHLMKILVSPRQPFDRAGLGRHLRVASSVVRQWSRVGHVVRLERLDRIAPGRQENIGLTFTVDVVVK